MERSCSERDLSALNYNKKRAQLLNEAKSEAQLFNGPLPDITNTPRKCFLVLSTCEVRHSNSSVAVRPF